MCKKKYGIILIIFIGLMVIQSASSAEGVFRLEEPEMPVYIAEGIRRVNVVRGNQEVLDIAYCPQAYEESYEYWDITVPYGETVVVDTESMLAFCHLFESIMLRETEVTEELKAVQQASSDRITVEFCQASEEERNAMINEIDYRGDSSSYQAEADSRVVYRVFTDQGGNYYASLQEDADKIYRLDGDIITSILNAEPYDLILKIVLAVPLDTLEEIEVTEPGKDTLVISGTDLKTIYSNLIGVIVQGETAESKLTENELLHVVFKRSDAKAPEITLIFHEYDGGRASAEVNGIEKLLVARADVAKIIEIVSRHSQSASVKVRNF